MSQDKEKRKARDRRHRQTHRAQRNASSKACNGAKRNRTFCPVHQTAPLSNGHSPGRNAQLGLWPEVKGTQ